MDHKLIEERAKEVAEYVIKHNATVRQAAKAFGVSKSTVHKDLTDENRLLLVAPELHAKVQVILAINKSEMRMRGVMAIKKKYNNL